MESGLRQRTVRAFVDRYGAEVALAVTTAVRGNRKSDCFQGLDLALPLVIRMLSALEIQPINGIQFGLCLGQPGWVLDQEPVPMFLIKTVRADRVVVAVKSMEHLDESGFIACDGLVGGQFEIALARLFGDVTHAPHVPSGPCHPVQPQRIPGRLFRPCRTG